MIHIIFIALLSLTFLNLIISDMDYFHPGVVFNAMFLLFTTMCCIVDFTSGIEINNILTGIIVISGALVFTFTNIISRKMVRKPRIEKDLKSIKLNTVYIIIAIAIELVVAYLMYKYVNDFARVYEVNGSFSVKLSFYDTITKFNSDYKLRMPWYVSVGNLIGRSICHIALYVAIKNYIVSKKIDFKYVTIVFIYFVGSLMGGRTEALRIVTAAIFLWYYYYKRKNGWKKGSLRIAIRMVFIAVLIVVGFSLMRGILGRSTYDPIKVVFGYMGASLKNLDTFLSNPQKSISGIWGAMTFTKFINWLGIKLNIPSWIYVSDQPFLYFKEFRMGNVYTTYYNFYYDFGFIGCIILIFLISVYYCYTYREIKAQPQKEQKIDFKILVYAYLFNDLIMLPFSSRFYETIVNINFIRIMIILGGLIYIINNINLKKGRMVIRLPRIMRKKR